MAHRHMVHKARGGKVEDTVEKEHEEMGESKKRGGRTKHEGKVHGKHGKHRLDKRARGGGVGADRHPFSSAHVK